MEFYDARDESSASVIELDGKDTGSDPALEVACDEFGGDDVPAHLLEQFSTGDLAPDAPEKNVDKARMAKEEGNDFYRAKDYDSAVEMYSQAINLCPEDEEDPEAETHRELFATFLGNRAAAFFALQEWDMVVDDCNYALDKKGDYIKVIYRRCQALEKLSRIDESLVDAKRVQELDPAFPQIDASVKRLQKAHDTKMEELKGEAMGKLKELGNSILGNFGMSVDQFKFEQDPTTGSYSIGTK
jgi:tetratricopeptide (TPR) repeat protein